MSERPILFSGPMVRAILEGRKTQTRRVISDDWWRCLDPEDEDDRAAAIPQCPYGVPGDRLWVRETWAIDFRPSFQKRHGISAPDRFSDIVYAADRNFPCIIDEEFMVECDDVRWHPSIFMRRAASRISLELTKVRVERVQDISEADAIAEGISVLPLQERTDPTAWYQSEPGVNQASSARWSYALLWDSINAKRGFGWEKNPWVWVLDFERTR